MYESHTNNRFCPCTKSPILPPAHNRQQEGSDLWLFSRATALTQNAQHLVVLLSPQANTRAWYTFDPKTLTLTLYTAKPTTVSYRLTAPRFDWENWANIRPDDAAKGLSITYGENEWQPTEATQSAEDAIMHLSITPSETPLSFVVS